MKTFQATHSVTHTAYWEEGREEEVGVDTDTLAPWKLGGDERMRYGGRWRNRQHKLIRHTRETLTWANSCHPHIYTYSYVYIHMYIFICVYSCVYSSILGGSIEQVSHGPGALKLFEAACTKFNSPVSKRRQASWLVMMMQVVFKLSVMQWSKEAKKCKKKTTQKYVRPWS